MKLDGSMKHLLFEFRQQASIILYADDRYHNSMEDETFVSEFGGTLFIIACFWRLLCDFGGLSEEISKPEHLLWWLFLVRNYPKRKQFEQIVDIKGRHLQKHLQPIKEAVLRTKKYVVRI